MADGARTVRQSVHLTTAGLVVTAFAVPATSGRAALALPVCLALAAALRDLSFVRWLVLELPSAVVSSPLAAELILATTTRRADRKGPVTITAAQIQEHSGTAVEGPFTPAESRCLPLATVVLLWCNEPLHGVPPAVVALIGALVATSPALGTVRFKDGLRTVPWPLLFTAATMAMGVALSDPGAADWPVGWIPLGAPTPPWVPRSSRLRAGRRAARLVRVSNPATWAFGGSPASGCAFLTTGARTARR